MNERHPVEHLSWAASTALFLFVGYFVFEALASMPHWFFALAGVIFAVSISIAIPVFLAIHLSAIHKIQHTDIPKVPAKKTPVRRVPAQLNNGGN